MRSYYCLLSGLFFLVPIGAYSLANGIDPGDILFESGTLGETGVSWADLESGIVPGTNVNEFVFTGVRFELSQPVRTSQVGGHFVVHTFGTFFGAIVALDDANDFPDSGDLSTPDVLGATTLTFPNPSAEVYGGLELQLDPGWYALVFGSGLFDTLGGGGAVRNGVDVGDPRYIAYVSSHWRDLEGTSIPFDDHRFVITGVVVPEPCAYGLLFVGSLALVLKARLHGRGDAGFCGDV